MSLNWLRSWRGWIDDTTGLLAEPEPVSSNDLICEHGKFLFNVEDLLDSAENRTFALVDRKIWKSLLVTYGADEATRKNPPAVYFLDDGSCSAAEPCDECINKRAIESDEKSSKFVGHAFTIRKVDQRGRCATLLFLQNDHVRNGLISIRCSSGRSARAAKARTTTRGRALQVLGVNHYDSVGVLKLKVFEATEVSPNEQMLYLTPKKLDQDEETRWVSSCDHYCRWIALLTFAVTGMTSQRKSCWMRLGKRWPNMA